MNLEHFLWYWVAPWIILFGMIWFAAWAADDFGGKS